MSISELVPVFIGFLNELFENGIGIKVEKQEIYSNEDLDSYLINKYGDNEYRLFIEDISKEHIYYYTTDIKFCFGLKNLDSEIFDKYRFPLSSFNFNNIFNAYMNNIIELDHVKNMFSIIRHMFTMIKDEKEMILSERIMNDNFKTALTRYFIGIKDLINNSKFRNKIERLTAEYGYDDKSYSTAVFKFIKPAAYAQKRQIFKLVKEEINRKYYEVTHASNAPDYLIEFKFNDGRNYRRSRYGANVTSCDSDSFSICVKTNAWNAIGLDNASANMPKMGMFKSVELLPEK